MTPRYSKTLLLLALVSFRLAQAQPLEPAANDPALEKFPGRTRRAICLLTECPAHGEEIELAEGEQFLVAPMVGTFYAAPTPNEPPYVSENDLIEPDQTVGIIEAMKLMNEIKAEVAGRVTRILAHNAQPVEYGQPLMVIQTNDA